jgi:outer membrane protein
MKKYIFSALAIAAMMVSCNNQSPKMDDQPAAAASGDGLKIAYVEVDSLMTQYTFAKDYSVTLQKKSNNARNTLNQKGNALQAAAANFQQKLNNNGFQSREQAASQQAAIERQQRDLQELQARLENELASETAKFNETLRDSLQNFLKVYNKDKKFDLILAKSGDNILIADKKLDVTQDVINGLNKRYKPSAKPAADTKKDEAKADEKK